MTEVRKESLSALLDGEASEIEVHRLVREYHGDDSLKVSWSSYQHISSTLAQSRESQPAGLDPTSHQKLFDRISEAVELEPAHAVQSERVTGVRSRAKATTYGGLALAASLVIAVFVGVQQNPESTEVPLATSPVSIQGPTTQAIVPQVVSHQPDAAMPELIELDEEKQRRLRDYLNQHDRMSRMNVEQQFVNYPEATR